MSLGIVLCSGCLKPFTQEFACENGHWYEEPEDYICPNCIDKGLVDYYCTNCSSVCCYYVAILERFNKFCLPECSNCEEPIEMVSLGPTLRKIEPYKKN